MKALFLILALASGGPWSLTDCIDYALEHNITVKQNEITVAQREVDLNTAENRRLPGLSGGVSQNFSFGRGLTADNTYANTNTTSTSFSVGTDVPIFQGFDITRGIQLSKLNLAAAASDLEKVKEDISMSIAQCYVQILYCKEILKVAQNQVETDEHMLERIKAMKASGKASNAEVAAQQSSLAQSRLSATQAENNLNLALLDLSQLLELNNPEGFDIVIPDASAYENKLLARPDDIFAEAVGIKPGILSEQIRLDYAELNIKRAKGQYLPSLSLSGGLGTNFYTSSGYEHKPFGTQLQNNFSQYIGLSLQVPIFSRFSTRNQVRSAQLSFDSQKLQLENTRKNLYKEIQQAYYNAVASQSKYESSAEAAQSAALSYDLTREKYENGMANVTEYNEAKSRYLEAESNHLQARYENIYQNKILDFYRGVKLEFR